MNTVCLVDEYCLFRGCYPAAHLPQCMTLIKDRDEDMILICFIMSMIQSDTTTLGRLAVAVHLDRVATLPAGTT